STILFVIMASPRSALHVITGMDIRYGGPTVSMPALAVATMRTGRYRNRVLDFAARSETSLYMDREIVQYISMPRNPWHSGFRSSIYRQVSQILETTDVVQTHGLWKAHNSLLALKARARGVPFVVSAHGMLQEWALRTKAWKKYPYYYVVERPVLARASCLRALTLTEVEDYRKVGLRVPIAVIPNGVDIAPLPSADLFMEKYSIPRELRLILFLGRI